MKKPKVTVCIPTYSRANLLKDALRSVLSQDYEDFEIVICDDHSTDHTMNVVKSFKDKRIRYIKNETNLGQFRNINKCIDLARGEYVIIFHDDDIMLNGLLKKEAQILDKHSNVGIVAPAYYVVDYHGRILSKRKKLFS